MHKDAKKVVVISNYPKVVFLFYRDPGDTPVVCYTLVRSRNRRDDLGWISAASAELEDCAVIPKLGRVKFGHALFLMPSGMAMRLKEGLGFREIDPDAPPPPEPEFDPDWFAELD